MPAFHDNRYWDVEVSYAKASPDEIHIHITASNRGPGNSDPAPVAATLVPQYLGLGRRGEKRALAELRGDPIETISLPPAN